MIEQSSRLLKGLLGILLVLILGTLAYVLLKQRGVVETPAVVVPEKTKSDVSVAPAVSQTPTLSPEEAQKQVEAVQTRVDTGTLTLEEANNQILKINAETIQKTPVVNKLPTENTMTKVQK